MLPVLGPFAAYLGTAAKLFGLVSKIYEWGERAVGRAHTSEEQRAAYVLRNAGMLLAAIRTLDNQVHSTIGALRTFNPNWTDEQRSQVTTRINDFAGQELVLPIVRQSLTELTGTLNDWQTWQLTKIKTEPIRQLLTCGLSIQVAAGASDVTPFDDARTLRTFLEGVRTASTSGEIDAVIKQADAVLEAFDRRTLADADHAFGELRQDILHLYPGLQDAVPDWAVSLDDLKVARGPLPR
jgi:hypothetical protein